MKKITLIFALLIIASFCRADDVPAPFDYGRQEMPSVLDLDSLNAGKLMVEDTTFTDFIAPDDSSVIEFTATVKFIPGTMELDDVQPATNDSSSSQSGANDNPYGQIWTAKLGLTKGEDIASGATIAITKGVIHDITGTADITSITAGDVGQIVILQFDGTAATNGVVDGNNLKIAGDFGYTPDDVLILYCDGTDWFEISRSVN